MMFMIIPKIAEDHLLRIYFHDHIHKNTYGNI